MNPAFDQKNWHIIEPNVITACKMYLSNYDFLKDLNDTTIALISKIDNSAILKDLGTMSLCNVIHKNFLKFLLTVLRGSCL